MRWERCDCEQTAVGGKYKLPSPSRATDTLSTTLTTFSSCRVERTRSKDKPKLRHLCQVHGFTFVILFPFSRKLTLKPCLGLSSEGVVLTVRIW